MVYVTVLRDLSPPVDSPSCRSQLTSTSRPLLTLSLFLGTKSCTASLPAPPEHSSPTLTPPTVRSGSKEIFSRPVSPCLSCMLLLQTRPCSQSQLQRQCTSPSSATSMLESLPTKRDTPDYWAFGRDLFQATAIDDDPDVVLSRNTHNAEFDYLIEPDELYAAQFFGINKDGILYVKANIQEADKREEFKFYIVAVDCSWNPRSNRALVTISVKYSSIRQELGFSRPEYNLKIV
ncbi:uncharacterized protein LOC128241516 isoform X2 [Mya arenaria]|nr:uncharacterized protein LOC128241516 isoform X2 [Mya arenaria]